MASARDGGPNTGIYPPEDLVLNEKIDICIPGGKPNSLLVVSQNQELPTRLDEEQMKVFATYGREEYEVHGNIYMSYIIVDERPGS